MRIRPIFAWFDLWVGLFIDRPRRRLYFFPIPMLGIVVEWGPRPKLYDPRRVTASMHGRGVRIENCVAGGDIVAKVGGREWTFEDETPIKMSTDNPCLSG